jgi:hypothetical protein
MDYETFEDELHAIRLAIYEEIKDMTPEEEGAYIQSIAAPVLKEYGLRTVTQVETDRQKMKEIVLS